MRLRESIIISANSRAVWPHLADPALHARWNPKVVSVHRDRTGPVRLGERFEMVYRMSTRETRSQVEVTVWQNEQRVVFRHRTLGRGTTERIAEENYEISPREGGVEVVQILDLTHAGIPWIFRLMMRFIHRFGWSAHEPYLSRLKRIVENTPATA